MSYAIAAGMHAQLGGHGNGGAEQKDDVEEVEGDGDDSMDREGVMEGERNQVEEGGHGEGGYEHIVVDEGWVAGKGGGNDVADEGHDDEDEDELEEFWLAKELEQREGVEIPPFLGG